jgi:uncharacterized protein (TIGR01777 family)
MIGSELWRYLVAQGDAVVPVSRRRIAGGIEWHPAAGVLAVSQWEGLDAVIHLAGENLGGARWTPARKQLLRDSRIKTTDLLSRTLAACEQPPKVLVVASAVGIYGNGGEQPLTESSPCGDDFLARLCIDWEAAADPARNAAIRTISTRFGVVLTQRGGALAKMLTLFKSGLGGKLGDGKQWLSWVALPDLTRAIDHCLRDNRLHGPVNVTSPNPVTNSEFTKTLGRALHRPTLLRVPRTALKVAFGEMAEATILASQRAMPVRLAEAGFRFEMTMHDALARTGNT